MPSAQVDGLPLLGRRAGLSELCFEFTHKLSRRSLVRSSRGTRTSLRAVASRRSSSFRSSYSMALIPNHALGKWRVLWMILLSAFQSPPGLAYSRFGPPRIAVWTSQQRFGNG